MPKKINKGMSFEEYLTAMTELIKKEPDNILQMSNEKFAKQLDEAWRDSMKMVQESHLEKAISDKISEDDIRDYSKFDSNTRKAMDSEMSAEQKKALDAYTNNELLIGQADVFSSFDSYDYNAMLYAWPLWTSLYVSSWVFAKIIDVTSSDMTRNGWSISINPERIYQIVRDENKLYRKDITPNYELGGVYKKQNKIISHIINATKWMLLYGGAVICLLDSTIENLAEYETSLKEIKPGSKINYIVADRWQGVIASTELVTDDESPDFGTPKFYSVRTPDGSFYRFHHTRVARFVNGDNPNFLKTMLMGWGMPMGARIYNEINRDERIKNMITSLLSKYNLEIVQTGGMKAYMHGELTPEMEANLDAKLSMINRYRHFNSMMFLDKDDQYSRLDGNVGGLWQLFDSNVRAVTGASSMPVVKLYGDQTSGLSGSSNDDLRLWEEHLAAERGLKLRKPIEKITWWLLMSEQIPAEEFSIRFESSITKTVNERIDETRAVLDMYRQLMDMGIYTKEMVLAELKDHGDLLFGDQIQQMTIEDLEEIEEEIDGGFEGDLGGDFEAGGNVDLDGIEDYPEEEPADIPDLSPEPEQ